MTEPLSLQIIGRKGLGGAERWFARFARALAETGARAELAIRAGGALEERARGPPPRDRPPQPQASAPISRRGG